MKNVEDFYPLSPTQQGILFHTLSAPQSKVYFIQFSCIIYGNLNTSAFRRAWQQQVERHPLLRISFTWEGLKEPVQVVHRQVKLPWEQQDWRHLTSVKQQEYLEAFLRSDREQGFKLSQPPLMRLTLIQLAENQYQLIWSGHHLIMDGWSSSILLQEVLAYYEAFSQGKALDLQQPCPYRDYVAWLQQQDLSQPEMFWRQWLRGVRSLTSLKGEKTLSSVANSNSDYKQQRLQFSEAETSALQSLAQQQQLTLNTLLQGAWALLLSHYSGKDDVVFGVVLAGRSAALSGITSIVGPLINTLPMRIQLEPEESLFCWLKQLRAKQTQMQQYEYSPLTKIQRWSEMPRGLPLFESVLNFQNYPLETTVQERQYGSLKLENYSSFGKMNYPLYIDILPRTQLLMDVAYDSSYFETASIAKVSQHLKRLLCIFPTQPNITVKTLLKTIKESDKQQEFINKNLRQQVHKQNLKTIKREVIKMASEYEEK